MNDQLPPLGQYQLTLQTALRRAGIKALVTVAWHDWRREAPRADRRNYRLLGARGGIGRSTLAVTIRPVADCPHTARQWYRDRIGFDVVAAVLHERLSCQLAYRLAYAVCVDGVWRPFDLPLLGECRLGRILIARRKGDMAKDKRRNAPAETEPFSAPVLETIEDLFRLFDLSAERDSAELAEFAQRLHDRFKPKHHELDVLDEHLASDFENRLAALERLNQQQRNEIIRLAKGRPISGANKDKNDIITR